MVEYLLPKQAVAGSSPVPRSHYILGYMRIYRSSAFKPHDGSAKSNTKSHKPTRKGAEKAVFFHTESHEGGMFPSSVGHADRSRMLRHYLSQIREVQKSSHTNIRVGRAEDQDQRAPAFNVDATGLRGEESASVEVRLNFLRKSAALRRWTPVRRAAPAGTTGRGMPRG